MERKYTILRNVGMGETRDPFGPGPSFAEFEATAAAEEPVIEVADLRPTELRTLRRDPTISAVAPVMPIRLIEALEATDEVSAAQRRRRPGAF